VWSVIRKKQRKKGEEGFTLIELIVVVAILGFLMAIAIPRYLTARVTAAQSATKANLHSLASALELYATENNQTTYPETDDVVTWLSTYIAQAPTPPGGSGNYRYFPIESTDLETNDGPFDSFVIWDPNSYGNNYYAVGPAGVIGEGTTFTGAVAAATGLTTDNLSTLGLDDEDNDGVALDW